MDEVTMWRVILGYLERIPGAMKEVALNDGETMPLSAGKDIRG